MYPHRNNTHLPVQFTTQHLAVKTVVDYAYLSVIINSRKEILWSTKSQIRFIETVLMGFPITTLCVTENEDHTYSLLEGVEPFVALKRFTDNQLYLGETHLRCLKSLAGATYETLPDDTRVQFDNARVTVHIITGIPADNPI